MHVDITSLLEKCDITLGNHETFEYENKYDALMPRKCVREANAVSSAAI